MSSALAEPGPEADRGDPEAANVAPRVELLRVDPRLVDVTASLFWATFPNRRLGRAGPDVDGRIRLTTDPPWSAVERARWSGSLDRLLHQGFAAGAVLREVNDRSGRRDELVLPLEPAAYDGGAWLVGPFASAAEAAAWAAGALSPPWVHDLQRVAGAFFADVFAADP